MKLAWMVELLNRASPRINDAFHYAEHGRDKEAEWAAKEARKALDELIAEARRLREGAPVTVERQTVLGDST